MVAFAHQYDALGHRTQTAAFVGASCDFVDDYSYDGYGRLASVRQHGVTGGNAVAEKRVDYTYDDAGQYATIARYADLAATDLVAVGTYGYDLAGRLVSLTYAKGQTTLADYDWTFDAANRMTQYVNSIDGTVDYTNDDAGQLTGADYDYQADETYVYDDNGNRVTANGATYATGAANQLLSDGTYRYTYDAEGNRIARFIDADQSGTITTGDTQITEFSWDYRNRMTAVTHYDTYSDYTGETPDQVVEYSYDFQNRLVRKTLDSDGDGDVDSSTAFVNDGNQVALQYDASGSGSASASDLAHRYLWGAAVDQILADEQTADLQTPGDVLWPLIDHLNTARDLASYDSPNDLTTIANHRVYNAFGKLTSETNPAVDLLFSFTGRLFDSDTNLQNNLNRWYDSAVGGWLSEDPIGYKGGINLYEYVYNSPTIRTDPLGLDFDLAACAIARQRYMKVSANPLSTARQIQAAYDAMVAACNPPPPPPDPPSPPKGGHDYLDCIANCIRQRTWTNAGTAAFYCCNAAGNGLYGRYPRAGFGRPSGSPSSWQHKVCMGGYFDKFGKLTGRVCVLVTITEGCFDIGAEAYCGSVCAANVNSY